MMTEAQMMTDEDAAGHLAFGCGELQTDVEWAVKELSAALTRVGYHRHAMRVVYDALDAAATVIRGATAALEGPAAVPPPEGPVAVPPPARGKRRGRGPRP